MNEHAYCELSVTGLVLAVALIVGAYHLGRWREQLWLLEICKPER
jgi:hypothetical protein